MFNTLDEPLIDRVALNLGLYHVGVLRCTSSVMHGLFKRPYLNLAGMPKLSIALLSGRLKFFPECVTRNPELLLCQLSLKDNAGRHFKSISLFNYILWSSNLALIKLSLNLIKPYPDIVKDFASQYHEQMKRGVTYQLNNEVIVEPVYSPQPLIDAMTSYTTNESRSPQDWVQKIGGQQKQLPFPWLEQFYDIKNEDDLILYDLLNILKWNELAATCLGNTVAIRRMKDGSAILLRSVDPARITGDIAHLNNQLNLTRQAMQELGERLFNLVNFRKAAPCNK